MIYASRARKEADIYRRTRCDLRHGQKLLPVNENKAFYIPLPFKLLAIEEMVEHAVQAGLNFCKVYNEITLEAENCLKDHGYKVKYYKNFIKISW